MKKAITTAVTTAIYILSVTQQLQAQSGIKSVLSDISKNNKTLQTQLKYWEAQKLKYKTGNTLYDPIVSVDFMYGTPNSIAGNQTDINFIQRFDFPTVYGKKKALASEKSKQADLSISAYKQEIFLTAKKVCIELVYHNKLQQWISERKIKTEMLLSDFQKKLEKGDGNILDVNKVKLQLIEINKDYQLNISTISQLNQRLTELNGGIEITFNDTLYPEHSPVLPFEEYLAMIKNNDPIQKQIEQQTEITKKQIELTKALNLPKFEAGYHYQGILGQNFHGTRIAMSIPMWENKNTIKHSQMELTTNEVYLDEYNNEQYYTTKKLYEKYIHLKKVLDDYQSELSYLKNIELLDKALKLGEISTIQYLLEVSYFKISVNNFLTLEKEYNEIVAEINKYDM